MMCESVMCGVMMSGLDVLCIDEGLTDLDVYDALESGGRGAVSARCAAVSLR